MNNPFFPFSNPISFNGPSKLGGMPSSQNMISSIPKAKGTITYNEEERNEILSELDENERKEWLAEEKKIGNEYIIDFEVTTE